MAGGGDGVRGGGLTPVTALLRLASVSKSFAGVRALRDVSFDLQPGEVHALVGENGGGQHDAHPRRHRRPPAGRGDGGDRGKAAGPRRPPPRPRAGHRPHRPAAGPLPRPHRRREPRLRPGAGRVLAADRLEGAPAACGGDAPRESGLLRPLCSCRPGPSGVVSSTPPSGDPRCAKLSIPPGVASCADTARGRARSGNRRREQLDGLDAVLVRVRLSLCSPRRGGGNRSRNDAPLRGC